MLNIRKIGNYMYKMPMMNGETTIVDKRAVISQYFANAVQLLAELFPLRYEDAKKNKTKAELEKEYKMLVQNLCQIIETNNAELRVWFANDCCSELLTNDMAQTLRLTLLAIGNNPDCDNIEK